MMEPDLTRTAKSKTAEQALRESEAQWRQLAETAPDVIISIDRNKRIRFINRTISAKNREDVVGKLATDFTQPGQAETLNKALDRVFHEQVSTEYEIMGFDKNKQPAWYHTRIAPVFVDGQVVSATLITRDITERKNMEVELKKAHAELVVKVQERTAEIRNAMSMLKATVDATADGIMVMDLNRKVVLCNEKFKAMWPSGTANPYLAEDGINALKVAAELMQNPESLKETTEVIYRNPESKSADILKFKDGRIIERISHPQILDGKIVGRVWSYRDITLQLRAEAERDRLLEKEQQARIDAEKSVRVRDDFLTMASHELRTPLTPLKLYLDWFKREARKISPEALPQAKNLLQSLDYTEREVDRLIQLTDDLLDVTRISAGQLHLVREPINLVELISQVCARKTDELNKRQCELTFLKPEPINGLWDYHRIEQVFTCLLDNAMKFGARKPVEVSIHRENDRAEFRVRDYGIGIAATEQEKIFQRFERANMETKFKGLGLGLYISREIVIAHGGTIVVESEIGKGSTFVVSLPK